MGLNKNVKNLYVAIVKSRVILASTNRSDFVRSVNEIYPEIKRSESYYANQFRKTDVIKEILESNDVIFLQKVK